MLIANGNIGTTQPVLQSAVQSGLQPIYGGPQAASIHHQLAQAWSLVSPRNRWRATNPGTRPVTRFTRNFTTETSATEGRHVPWSFHGPFVSTPGAGTPMHYFRHRRAM